jgi:hypothetical protein
VALIENVSAPKSVRETTREINIDVVCAYKSKSIKTFPQLAPKFVVDRPVVEQLRAVKVIRSTEIKARRKNPAISQFPRTFFRISQSELLIVSQFGNLLLGELCSTCVYKRLRCVNTI